MYKCFFRRCTKGGRERWTGLHNSDVSCSTDWQTWRWSDGATFNNLFHELDSSNISCERQCALVSDTDGVLPATCTDEHWSVCVKGSTFRSRSQRIYMQLQQTQYFTTFQVRKVIFHNVSSKEGQFYSVLSKEGNFFTTFQVRKVIFSQRFKEARSFFHNVPSKELHFCTYSVFRQ